LPEDRDLARRPPPTHRTTVIPIGLLSSVSDSVTQGSPVSHRGITRNERRRALGRLRMRLGGICGTLAATLFRLAGGLTPGPAGDLYSGEPQSGCVRLAVPRHRPGSGSLRRRRSHAEDPQLPPGVRPGLSPAPVITTASSSNSIRRRHLPDRRCDRAEGGRHYRFPRCRSKVKERLL
jgi:hypothetical protein